MAGGSAACLYVIFNLNRLLNTAVRLATARPPPPFPKHRIGLASQAIKQVVALQRYMAGCSAACLNVILKVNKLLNTAVRLAAARHPPFSKTQNRLSIASHKAGCCTATIHGRLLCSLLECNIQSSWAAEHSCRPCYCKAPPLCKTQKRLSIASHKASRCTATIHGRLLCRLLECDT